MSYDLLPHDAVADELRALAAAAAPAVRARPDLAQLIIDRARKRRRRLGRTGALVGGGLMIFTAAAAVRPGPHSHFTVIQPSAVMEPTVRVEEQVVFSRRLAPERGDVVYVHIGVAGYDHNTISRVVALDGDTVSCPARPGGSCPALVVNGRPVPEPYLAEAETDPFPATRVPHGRVFLMGDNRADANDSRRFGPIDADEVKGVGVRIVGRDGQARQVPGAPTHPAPGDKDITAPPSLCPRPARLTTTSRSEEFEFPGVALPIEFMTPDDKTGISIWQAPSVDALRHVVESVVGGWSDTEYLELEVRGLWDRVPEATKPATPGPSQDRPRREQPGRAEPHKTGGFAGPSGSALMRAWSKRIAG